MNINIVDASQVHDKWFLIGEGSEISLLPVREAALRLLEAISQHLAEWVGFWAGWELREDYGQNKCFLAKHSNDVRKRVGAQYTSTKFALGF